MTFGTLALKLEGQSARMSKIKNGGLGLYGAEHSKYIVSQKNCAKLFLSELRQISTNFDNFSQKEGKEAKIMRGALIFHLT